MPQGLKPDANCQTHHAGAGQTPGTGSPRSIQRRVATSPALALIHGRLRGPNEASQFAHDGSCASLVTISILRLAILRKNGEAERLTSCHIRARRLVQQNVDLVTNCGQLEPVGDCEKASWLTVSIASPYPYSAGERRSVAGGGTGYGASPSGASMRWRPRHRETARPATCWRRPWQTS